MLNTKKSNYKTEAIYFRDGGCFKSKMNIIYYESLLEGKKDKNVSFL